MNILSEAVLLHFAQNRIRWSRVILVLTLLVVVFNGPSRYLEHWVLDTIELVGYALLVAATLLRIWCLIFIGGSKDGELASQGPYSVVRNPLYIGSLFGIVGMGLAVGIPLLAAALAVVFGMLYPAVVKQEERRLLEIFGEPYRRYYERVPRWIPRWSQYCAPEIIVVSTPKVQQGILDGMWYLWAFAFTELLDILRHHVLPHFF